MKKIKSPLKRRVTRELFGEWQKYTVIALFLILMIGFISGMFVANHSMLTSAENKKKEYNLEDGCFELNKKADEKLISAVEKGEKADIRQYYLDKGYEEADKEVKKVVDENLKASMDDRTFAVFADSEDYQKALDEAKEEAHKEVEKEVNKEYDKAVEKYDLEDPDFKPVKIKLYENFYKDAVEDNDLDGEKDGNIRIYKDRDDVDLYSIHKGKMPSNENEIAIDRMHADNVNIKVGDTINVGGNDYKVTALIALVNYSTLYEKPTDSMFDAIYFDVAIVTDEGFDRLNKSIHYNYAWTYENKPADEKEEKKLSENVMGALISQAVVSESEIEGFLPNYSNKAIHFATNDMGGDKTISGIMLYILIAVLSFIFAITISNTITKEASVIGTLRASGYTKGELVVHYMTMPVLVTLIAAIIGNILGYTCMKLIVINMYYNSYSLPTYETIWSSEAFIKTTLVPVIIMFVVNLIVIARMMRFSPLSFLRHDLKIKKRKKAMRIPSWKFMSRFRVRVLLQNIPNYIVLMLGITFVMLMMSMAVGFPESLDKYQKNVADMMFVKNQMVLKENVDEDGNRLKTTTSSAESFCMTSLEFEKGEYKESISVYGIEKDSKYVKIPRSLEENEVYISTTFSDKYDVEQGDTIKLGEKYDNTTYEFTVAGIYDYSGALTVFMPDDNYRSCFDKDADYFTGYMSDDEIKGIDDKYVATTITIDDVLKISRQLDHSIGGYMVYFQYLCIILSAVLIYLLTKIIIEKNENSISMVKILGYENGEISSLYLLTTTIVVVISCIVGIALGYFLMNQVFKIYLMSMEGWFNFVISVPGLIKMFCFVFIAYLIVMVFDYRRIKKIPMDEALKNVE